MEYFNVRDAENLLYISFTPNIFVESSFSSSSKESVTLKSANVIFLTFLCQFKDPKSSFLVIIKLAPNFFVSETHILLLSFF